MNDEVNIPYLEENRILSYVLMGRYGNNSISTYDEWYNLLHKRQLLINSVRDLNKCGVEVDYSNRDKIIHNYE